jgi:hypothetical protein
MVKSFFTTKNIFCPTFFKTPTIYKKEKYMKNNNINLKSEFVRLRMDLVEKSRLDKLCKITRRQKSDLVREGLFELYKTKYPECLND